MTAVIPAQRTSDMLARARAEALFASSLSALTPHTRTEIEAAIRAAVRTHDGVAGCACEVAREYGEHPETACARMRWARATVEAEYAKAGGRS